ncbi:universal stress protein [Kriegella aquimaris]|uniref:Nucleotide-binding universal stress protein, UspA family n=1 Tax=Kriegella aquimaris TaxID=192904 RepID=A0A1G9LMA9_9FLAO|nr:universal stress protein [Kriegella aquimaris]SDL63026.1 Nucleotide-binding universal stress protein, UspA family [Kriegella aquimaris]
MDKISTILVPFNFSRTSKKALEYAVQFIGQNKSMKIILGYITDDHNVDMLQEAFSTVIEKYKIKVEIEWLATSGSLTDALVKIQKEEKIDLIIMGTFGTIADDGSGVTNTSKLVLHVDCPVLVVPYGSEDFRIKNIALVLGKEEIENRKTLGILLDIGRKFNAKVHVVTIENQPELYGYSNIEVRNENTLAYYLEDFYSDHTFIENPDVLLGILSYASEKAIDMIAILPRNHSKKSEPSKGKLTQLLTLHSKIPILAID